MLLNFIILMAVLIILGSCNILGKIPPIFFLIFRNLLVFLEIFLFLRRRAKNYGKDKFILSNYDTALAFLE